MDPKIYGEFWSPLRLERTGKPLLMSAGSRGIGKSTGMALKCIGDYYDNGTKFIYCRRTDDELKRTRKNYFDGALKIYNAYFGTEHNWVYNQETYVDENDQIVGYSVPLNLADKYKSATYGADHVRTIIYDEFILRRGKESGYLGTKDNNLIEYDLLIGLYQTVDRAPGHPFLNETKIYCLGNYANPYNPIFLGAGADEFVEHNSKFVNPKTMPWAIEFTSEVGATNDMKNSNGYKLSREEMAKHDYDNIGFTITENVKKMKGIRSPLLNLTYHGRHYGLFSYERQGVLYVSTERAGTAFELALTMEDSGKINQVTALKYQWLPELQMLRKAAQNGFLVFENDRAKNDILTYLDFTV